MSDKANNVQQNNNQNQIKVVFESPSYSVAPGGRVSIPVKIKFSGDRVESLLLKAAGIPSEWVYVPHPVLQFEPGEQKELIITVQPPALPEGRAGRYRLDIEIVSQLNPDIKRNAQTSLVVACG